MIRDFIKALGGPNKVAEQLQNAGHDANSKAVTAWGLRESIPWKWRGPVADLVRNRAEPPDSIPAEIEPFLRMAATPEQAGAGQ